MNIVTRGQRVRRVGVLLVLLVACVPSLARAGRRPGDEGHDPATITVGQLDASGMSASATTLTVTTANAVATFSGLDLVALVNSVTNETYLEKPSSSRLAVVDAISGTAPAQQLSNWTIGTDAGTGQPIATITSSDALRSMTMTVGIDPATQEVVVRTSASVTSPGVRGASWSIAGLDLTKGRWIVPANSGSVFDAAHPGIGAFIAYPNSWQAQMAVYEGATGSLLLYSTDTQLLFKQLRQTTRGDSTLDVAVYTEATAPWPSATAVPAVEWRLKAFAGDWRAAAQPFRDWMHASFPPTSNAAHPWVSNIRTVVRMPVDASLLAPLAAKLNPSQTLIYLPDWRQDAYDVNYPNYTPAAGVASFVTAAHALGFKVMLHTDVIGVTPSNADYAGVQQYQTRTSETLQLMGQFWDQPSNPLRYGLIDPAASAFRTLWITRITAAVNAVHPDALHLDFTAMYNDGNGLIEGRTFTQGEDLFNQQIVAAFPNLAIGSEEEFDFTYRYHSFMQAGLWAFSAPGHPISAFLFSPHVLFYSNLSAPTVSDPAFKSHLDQMARRSILPTWWVTGQGDLDTANVDSARFIAMAQSWQSHAFQPAWTTDWAEALIRYEGSGGATAALTDTGQVLGLRTPQSTLFQLAHDANRLTTGAFIARWPAFDDTTLYGLNPSSLYFVDAVARPDATHVTSLPEGIQLGGGTLVTPAFAHVEFAPPTALDFTNLALARSGVRYQDADHPIGFGAVVQVQTHPVGGESRTGIFIHPPWQGQVGGETFAEYSVPVPSGAALRFSVGVDDGASCTDGVMFRVTVGGTEVWRQVVTRGAWHDAVLSLAAYAGTTVPVRLVSNPGPASDPSCDWASWTKVAITATTPAIDVPLQLASGSTFSGIDGASYVATSPTSGTVTHVAVPGGFTIFTQPGTAVSSGTGLTTVPFAVWSADQGGGLLKPGSVFNAGSVGSYTSGGVTKNPAIWAHPPNGGRTVLSWALRLPDTPLKLGWSAGVNTGAYSDDGVAFEVRVNGLPYWSLTTGVHGDDHWTSGQLDLARWQGQSILLELVSDSRGNNNADWASWADLVLTGSSTTCSYGVPPSAEVAGIGGTATASVTATATCSWSTSSSVPWLTVASGSGSGNGTVAYDVAPNLGEARSGTLTIAGRTITVNQQAAPPAPLTVINLSRDLVPLGIAATNMAPNQPSLDAGPLFVAGVNYAKAHGIATVVADPGTYHFLSVKDNTHVAVSGIDDMMIDLHGADLIFTHPLYYGLIVYGSRNAVIQNFTVDYQPLPFTQVRVASVDLPNAQIQYALESGWPGPVTFNSVSLPPGLTSPEVQVHVFRSGRPVLSRLFTQLPLGGDRIPVVNSSSETLAAVRPGDVLAISLRGYNDAVNANHCVGCTLRNITVFACGCGGAAVGTSSAQSTLLERIYAIPKPGTDRLISTISSVALGFSGPSNRIRLSRGIRTTDDAFWFYGRIVGVVQGQTGGRALSVAATTAFTWKNMGDAVPNGTTVGFEHMSTGAKLGEAVISSQGAPGGSPPYETTFNFDRDLPPNLVGTVMYTTDASLDGANSVIERSAAQSVSCCRGIYIAGLSNSALRGNYIRHSAFAGIAVLQGMTPGDPPTAPLANLEITNNVIDGTNTKADWWWFELGAIQAVTLTPGYDLMTGSPFTNLNITNNFVGESGRSAVWLGNTSGGSITGNYLLRPNARPDVAHAYPGRPGDALRPVVVDTTSNGITAANNIIDLTSGRVHVTDAQYRELAAYAPGATIRLSAYGIGTLASASLTLTDADGVTTPMGVAGTMTHALDVQLPPGAALGGAYVTLTGGGLKYFGTLFVDSQDNIPAVNGCTYESSPASTTVPASASTLNILVVTQAGCASQALTTDAFVEPGAAATGTAVIGVAFAANPGAARTATIELAGQPLTVTQADASVIDSDGDGLPDAWEATYGLDPGSALGDNGASGDPDGDGATNLQEFQAGTHPRGIFHRYFAEGATSAFFATRVAIANPGAQSASVLATYQRPDGSAITQQVTVPAVARRTIVVNDTPGMATAEFSTAIDADQPVVVDRTMSWDVANGYGAHAETAITAPAMTWYLAEGSTVGGFNLFYLLQNPNAGEAQVRVRYLRPTGTPLEKAYTLPPRSRTNIWVNQEDFPGVGKALAATDVSAAVDSTNGQPIIVERAMYLDVPGQVFGAGHESAGVTAPATQWFLAEGATGTFFDLFVLIANPNDAAAEVEAIYLLPDGTTVTKAYRVGANSRFNIWVDFEDARLADTAVSTSIRSTNGVPVIVERAMWWPGGHWYEAHNSPGATTTGTKWALAEGEVGGSRGVATYILVANTSPTTGTVKVTLLFEDGANAERTFTVAANSRFNVDTAAEFPSAAGRRFGAIVESVGDTPAQIVVERAMYWDALGQTWAAGTNALATRLR